MVRRDSDSDQEPSKYRSRRKPVEYIDRCNGIYRRSEAFGPKDDGIIAFQESLKEDTDGLLWGDVMIESCDDAAPTLTFPRVPTTVLPDFEDSAQLACYSSPAGKYYLELRRQIADSKHYFQICRRKCGRKRDKANRRRREIAIDAIHDADCAVKLVEIWFDQCDRPPTSDATTYAANVSIAIGRLLERLAIRPFEHFVDGARRLAQRGAAGRQSSLAKKQAQIEAEKPLYQEAVNYHFSAGASYARAKQIVAREFDTTPGIVAARTIHPRHFK
ncbi:MAG: hypothetical protein C0485_09580 [Pirellula sp.]|nr:hypothetical protein [Pirellula sp.]